jgi:predicted transcriptional regulator
MTTLKVGIASYEEMKARTMAVARGERRVAADEPKVWFTSTESFAKVLSAGNRELLRVIAEKAPGSLDQLARITGKAKSNLSRTLRAMEGYGLVRLERGERGRITPKVMHDRVDLQLSLADVPPSAMPVATAEAVSVKPVSSASRPQRDTNARLIAEVLMEWPSATARPADIRKALKSDKGVSLAFTSIRHGLDQLAKRHEVVASDDGRGWRYIGKEAGR